MRKDAFLSTIPFAGFYGSVHEDELDREVEYFMERIPHDSPVYDSIQSLAWDAADFGAARLEYAQEYAAAFLDWLSLNGKFESMDSPREYNFATDRIFVTLTRADIARLWRGVPREDFTKACRDQFTSRSGFISHYSPDWRDWGPISTWDHNQIGTLVECFAEYEQGKAWDSWAEHELMESYLCNGGVHGAMWQGDKADRLWRIANYLEERAARPIKTMDQWHAARRAENRPFSGTPLGQWGAPNA